MSLCSLPEDVTGIRVRMHAGDDMVTGSGFGDLILGGPGSDTLFGEAGRDTMDRWPRKRSNFGGDNFDRLFDSDGDDLVDTGGRNRLRRHGQWHPRQRQYLCRAGQATLSFDDCCASDHDGFETKSEYANGRCAQQVQATGFSYFIGTPFNDQFSIGGDVPLLFTFDGGLGSDTLTVDAKGLPTINDGKRVQVMGFRPIEYTNFDRINIINALPGSSRLGRSFGDRQKRQRQSRSRRYLQYVVTITNDGVVDARDLLFEDTLDLDMELVTGLLNISPIALDDIYVVRGPLNVNSSSGLLANDFDIDGSVPGTNADLVLDIGSVTRISDPTTSTFTAQPDGSFTYTPEPGFQAWRHLRTPSRTPTE
ncbi:MAG: Ig-like domain-containing protein [Pirellulaceae bacterium]